LVVDEAEDDGCNGIGVGGIAAAGIAWPPQQFLQEGGPFVEGRHVPFPAGGARDHVGGRGPNRELAIRAEVSSCDRPRRERDYGDDAHTATTAGQHVDQLSFTDVYVLNKGRRHMPLYRDVPGSDVHFCTSLTRAVRH